jgi:hypothetical protein
MVLGIMYSFQKRWEAEFGSGSMYLYCQKTDGHVNPIEVIKKLD